MSGHRSAAQNGQYSAPTNSTSGLPVGDEVRLARQESRGGRAGSAALSPDADRVEDRGGTWASVEVTLGGVGVGVATLDVTAGPVRAYTTDTDQDDHHRAPGEAGRAAQWQRHAGRERSSGRCRSVAVDGLAARFVIAADAVRLGPSRVPHAMAEEVRALHLFVGLIHLFIHQVIHLFGLLLACHWSSSTSA